MSKAPSNKNNRSNIVFILSRCYNGPDGNERWAIKVFWKREDACELADSIAAEEKLAVVSFGDELELKPPKDDHYVFVRAWSDEEERVKVIVQEFLVQ